MLWSTPVLGNGQARRSQVGLTSSDQAWPAPLFPFSTNTNTNTNTNINTYWSDQPWLAPRILLFSQIQTHKYVLLWTHLKTVLCILLYIMQAAAVLLKYYGNSCCRVFGRANSLVKRLSQRLHNSARKLGKVSARNTFPIYNEDWSDSPHKASQPPFH